MTSETNAQGHVRGAGRRRVSLRSRLMFGVLALVAIGFTVGDVVTVVLARTYLVRRVDEQLQGVSKSVNRRYDRTDFQEPHDPGSTRGVDRTSTNSSMGPTTFFIERQDSTGTVINQLNDTVSGARDSVPALPRVTPDNAGAYSTPFTTGSVDPAGPQWRAIAITRTDNTTAFVAAPLAEMADTIHYLVLFEVAMSTLVLAVVGVLGWWMIRIGLRPLVHMERTADAIADGDLEARVESTDPRTEVGHLGLALNRMLGRIQDSVTQREESEDRLRRFVADASHELRTPVAAIRGYTELYQSGISTAPGEIDHAMKRINRESRRMGTLIDDLLLLARLDAATQPRTDNMLATERPRLPVDFSTVVTNASDDAQAIDPDRPLNRHISEGITLDGDAGLLHQLVANLLANIRDHTPPNAPATIALTGAGGEAILSVTDSGPGIPPGLEEQIFERFRRADPSRARSQGGAGLGLAIVQAIVHDHNGTVHVAKNTTGAQIVVTLPARNVTIHHDNDQPDHDDAETVQQLDPTAI